MYFGSRSNKSKVTTQSQGIALRSYLLKNGLKTSYQGGNVALTPVANPHILTLFLKKQLDGEWVAEPWATRLVNEANGKNIFR